MSCPNCGAEIAPDSSYCPFCGVTTAPRPQDPTAAVRQAQEYRLRYSLWRVGILGAVSLGLYFLYWMYVTWKALSTETSDRDHYPLWRALAMFVPALNLFLIYDHFRTIRDLQAGKGLRSNIDLAMVVVVAASPYVILVLDILLSGDKGGVLGLFTVVPLVGLMVWGQANLNSYWDSASGGTAGAARFGAGEVILSVVGALGFLLVILGLALPGPSVNSVYEAGTITPIRVGVGTTDAIEGSFDIDAFSFEASQGTPYIIEVGVDFGREATDPLEDPMLGLWDTDGSTVLDFNDDFGDTLFPRIDWTAPASGTYFLTVENADLASTGEYVLSVVIADR